MKIKNVTVVFIVMLLFVIISTHNSLGASVFNDDENPTEEEVSGAISTLAVQGGAGGTAPIQGGAGGTPVVGTGVYIPTAQETGLPGGTIQGILKNLLNWMLEIVGVIALIGFAIAGIQYVLAAGDEKLAETAKKNMTNAIMGIVVVLASFVIIQAIDYALRAQSSSF